MLFFLQELSTNQIFYYEVVTSKLYNNLGRLIILTCSYELNCEGRGYNVREAGMQNPLGTAENQRKTTQLTYGTGQVANQRHHGERRALCALRQPSIRIRRNHYRAFYSFL